MMCQGFDRRISAFVDGQLTEPDHKEVSLHLDVCSACASEKKHLEEMRATLRALPVIPPPVELETELRVVASKERARRVARASASALLRHWHGHFSLWMNNLMRPLAIPAAGGLASAVVLFSMLVPTFSQVHMARQPVEGGIDVPTPFYTAATVKSSRAPFGLVRDELLVDVTIDGNGRMVEYSIPSGQPILDDPELIRALATNLLFTEFTPATTFGQPMYGAKIRVYIRRSTIDVKG